MRALPLILLALACGGSSSTSGLGFDGTPVTGEGKECPTGSTSSCDANEACATYTAYQSSTGTCRTVCDAGCSKGESCGSDGTCQCTPTLTRGASSDTCGAANLICHPDFRVCQPAVPGDAGCQGGEVYSPLWTMCVLPG